METLTIEIKTAKARKLIDDLIDLGIISLKVDQPAWVDLWNKADSQLPQTEPGITEDEIMTEIKAHRLEKQLGQPTDPA
ncbi:hypothetical protein [Spirosoma agri]|uniref:Uncharacterized protein n=1 Tax=Spirosoma agri TaxID=1987381 RepID=A0A6M0IC59_9BACT|nr:hypothetical protein [Spirosoma agri]NEU65820.1 hypothetical protein [Spirosoma agri]